MLFRLFRQLNEAGFFRIQWEAAGLGATYVRPNARGVLRMFVPAHTEEVELYAGSLAAGELRYRGPVPPEAELRQLLAGGFGRPWWPSLRCPTQSKLACAA